MANTATHSLELQRFAILIAMMRIQKMTNLKAFLLVERSRKYAGSGARQASANVLITISIVACLLKLLGRTVTNRETLLMTS
jgi:hypothetical protein